MKKGKWMSLLLFLTAVLLIFCFHTRFDLVNRVAPPSDLWGRNMQAGTTVFKKDPVTFLENGNVNIIFGNEEDFQKAAVSGNGGLIGVQSLGIQGYNPEKIVKYGGNARYLLWTENYDLFLTDFTDPQKGRMQLASGVNDFQLIESENGTGLAVLENQKLALYRMDGNRPAKLAEIEAGKNMQSIAGCFDKRGGIFVASVSKTSPTDYELRLFELRKGSNVLQDKIRPVVIENNYSTREGSNSINSLRLAADDENIYIFYEIGKMSGQGMVARTYTGRLPQDGEGIQSLVFERLRLKKQEREQDPFISFLYPLSGQGDTINAMLSAPIKNLRGDESAELVYITLDKGQIIEEKMATNTGRWNTNAALIKAGDNYFTVFLQTMGSSRYRVSVSSTGEAYKSRLNRTTMEDVELSVMEVIAAYMFLFYLVFINLLITAPVLLWPICVDFFEWRFFFRNPNLTYHIGTILEILAMIFAVRNIYKDADSVSFMPGILKFYGAPAFYLLATFAAAYAVVHFYRKGNRDLHLLPELGLFLLTHNILIYLLFSVYIVRF